MIRATLLASMTLAATLSIALPAPAQDPPTAEVVVTIDPTQSAPPIPPEYTGLSFSLQNILPLPDNSYFFRPDNKPLVTLFKTLGIHTLRIADTHNLNLPTPADLDSLFTFAKAAGCKIEFQLRQTDDFTDDVALAKYINDHYKNELLTFEWSVGTGEEHYRDSFDAFIAAFKNPDVYPDFTVSAPFVFLPGGGVENMNNLVKDYADKGILSAVSLSAYPGGPGGTLPDPAGARTDLLSSTMNDQYQHWFDSFSPSLTAAKLPFRLVETNSFYSSGAKDVSNTHAAALWTLDYLHWWAAHGAAGLNLHVGGRMADPAAATPSAYAPFWTSSTGYHPHPPAYAIKAFDLAAHGAPLPVTLLNAGEVNLTAYAVLNPDKSIYLTLINKELGDNAKTAAIKLSVNGYHTEQFITLTADKNDPAASDSETLGNAPITDDGTWTGQWTTTTEDSPPLAPTTATILHLKPN